MTDLRLDLVLGEVLQGEFELGSRNLILVFQVNCPGCFLHALPTAESIHRERHRNGLTVVGLSTAFEDFELNTIANTRALLERSEFVGEMKHHLAEHGIETYPEAITFPIACDAGMDRGVGATFARNRLPGTPTWILCDAELTVEGHQFGHLSARAGVTA